MILACDDNDERGENWRPHLQQSVLTSNCTRLSRDVAQRYCVKVEHCDVFRYHKMFEPVYGNHGVH